jgi:hypothetical protein
VALGASEKTRLMMMALFLRLRRALPIKFIHIAQILNGAAE